jgi:hypothetical protein
MRFGVSYFGVRDFEHACRDLDEIAGAGFRSITHTFSEHDLRYHRGDVARLVSESKARGLETALDPWGVGGLFGGEAYSEAALVHLAARQVDARGQSVPACCPNARVTSDLLRGWTAAAVSMEPDVLFWDEPHFYLGALRDGPAAPCCRCEACRAAWRSRGGEGELPPEGSSRLESFRADSLRRLISGAVGEAVGSGVRHALCLLPLGEHSGAASDDWESWTLVDGIDRIATDPYWMDRPVDPAEFVTRHAGPLRGLCDRTGKEMELWVQGIRIPAGEEEKILRAAEAAATAGADVVSFWSFRGTGRMASLACGDPAAAWEAMKEAVRRFA